MKVTWTQAILPAIEDADYLPLRGEGDDEGGIADEAISRIRRIRLVVSDFTWARETAYYEAGLASGLGYPGYLDRARTPRAGNTSRFRVV